MTHACDASTRWAEADLCEFRVSLLHRVHGTMTSQMPLASVFTHCGVCVYELHYKNIKICALGMGEPSLTYFKKNSIAWVPIAQPWKPAGTCSCS